MIVVWWSGYNHLSFRWTFYHYRDASDEIDDHMILM